jgi:parallel beta-helix repeat protein
MSAVARGSPLTPGSLTISPTAPAPGSCSRCGQDYARSQRPHDRRRRCRGRLGNRQHRGHEGVTIENGSVREFAEGIVLVGAGRNRLRGLVVSHHTGHGIFIQDSSRAEVVGNASVANIAGIIVSASSAVRVEQNTVSDNEFSGIGLFASEHSGSLVIRFPAAGTTRASRSTTTRTTTSSSATRWLIMPKGSTWPWEPITR